MCRIYHDNILCSSAKVLAETIHTIFDFFSILETLFFQQQTSKPTRILSSHQNHFTGFFCVFFYFQASLMQLVHCSDWERTKFWKLEVRRLKTEIIVEWKIPQWWFHIIIIKGHFLIFLHLWGLENYYTTHKRSVHIIHHVS